MLLRFKNAIGSHYAIHLKLIQHCKSTVLEEHFQKKDVVGKFNLIQQTIIEYLFCDELVW